MTDTPDAVAWLYTHADERHVTLMRRFAMPDYIETPLYTRPTDATVRQLVELLERVKRPYGVWDTAVSKSAPAQLDDFLALGNDIDTALAAYRGQQ